MVVGFWQWLASLLLLANLLGCLGKFLFLPTANSQQPTANSQQPTANSQQPTANSQQPTANSNFIIFTQKTKNGAKTIHSKGDTGFFTRTS
jgi:hypothetical protein